MDLLYLPVLGLELIKMAICNHNENKSLNELIGDIIKLNLIKDWDFTMCAQINKHDKIIEKAKKYNMIKESETIIVLRIKNNVKIDNEALFEISIKESDPLSELELPMTTMKIEITEQNITNLFELSKIFFLISHNPSDYVNYISQLVNNITNLTIIIPEHENGYFKVNDNFDDGNLSKYLLALIDDITPNINEKQFLIAQIKQPDRMFYRLLGKNANKSMALEKLLKSHSIEKTTWLLNIDHINELITKFTLAIGNNVTMILKKYECQLNEIYDQIETVNRFICIIENENVINYCDLEQHYNNDKFDEIKNLYIGQYEKIYNLKISKGYIKKIKIMMMGYVDNYIKILVTIFNELNLITIGVNMGRLVGLYHTFPIIAKNLIKNIMPNMDTININKEYFNKMIIKKKLYNQMQKNGFFQIFYKLNNN